jgi:hypothetical protein
VVLGGIPVERYGGLVGAETVYWGNFLVDLIDVHVPLLSLCGGRVETLSGPEGLGVLIGFSDRVRDIDPPDMPEGGTDYVHCSDLAEGVELGVIHVLC